MEKERAAPRPRKKVKMLVGEGLLCHKLQRLLLLGHGCGSKAVKCKIVKLQRVFSSSSGREREFIRNKTPRERCDKSETLPVPRLCLFHPNRLSLFYPSPPPRPALKPHPSEPAMKKFFSYLMFQRPRGRRSDALCRTGAWQRFSEVSALYLPTFSHMLIVNKFLSLPGFFDIQYSIYEAIGSSFENLYPAEIRTKFWSCPPCVPK